MKGFDDTVMFVVLTPKNTFFTVSFIKLYFR